MSVALAVLRGVVGAMPSWMSLRGAAVMLVLDEAPGGALRHKFVALRVDMPAPSATRIFDLLAAHGLVERVRHTSHNVDIALTPAGRDLARQIADSLTVLNGGRQ